MDVASSRYCRVWKATKHTSHGSGLANAAGISPCTAADHSPRNTLDDRQKSTIVEKLVLRSRPPFTGVLRGPGLKVPHGVFFEQFWAPASECPKECFLSAFWRVLGSKSTQKALFGALRGRCPNCSKNTPWGTFRPGPRSTPVNGGQDRKVSHYFHFNLVSRASKQV